MRHSKTIRNKVRNLRFEGFSLNQIFYKTYVPKTTIRSWIKDVKLTEDQLIVLRERIQKALQAGRVKAQKSNKDKRIEKEKKLFNLGKAEIGKLTPKELFIAGVCLYWAEGFNNKHERRLGFCNSNPKMIGIYLKWLQRILKVNKKDVVARLTINEAYKEKANEIQDHWAKMIDISPSQFTKPFFQRTKWKREYLDNNYYGVLRIHVKNSLDEVLKMRGWIEGVTDSC